MKLNFWNEKEKEFLNGIKCRTQYQFYYIQILASLKFSLYFYELIQFYLLIHFDINNFQLWL